MAQLLRSIAFLSNESIESVSCNNFIKAGKELTSALSLMKDLMVIVDANDVEITNNMDGSGGGGGGTNLEKENHPEPAFFIPLHTNCSQFSQYVQDEIVSIASSMEEDESVKSMQSLQSQASQLSQLQQQRKKQRRFSNAGNSNSNSNNHKKHQKKILHQDQMESMSECKFVYDTPLYICARTLQMRTLNRDLLSQLSVALMFNLGLCHHMRALYMLSSMGGGDDGNIGGIVRANSRTFNNSARQQARTSSSAHSNSMRGRGNNNNNNNSAHSMGSSCSWSTNTHTTRNTHYSELAMMFRQAISLYELAYEVQIQDDIELSVEITMAIANNLGRAHQSIGNRRKASKCFRHLLTTLLFVKSSMTHGRYVGGSTNNGNGSDDELDLILSPISKEGFVRSVSHLILKKQAASAA